MKMQTMKDKLDNPVRNEAVRFWASDLEPWDAKKWAKLIKDSTVIVGKTS